MSEIFVVGSINMDLVIKTDIIPDAGVTVSGRGFMTNPGGKGANQAVAVAKSGGSAHMVGCVGREFGNSLIKTLQEYDVDTSFVQNKSDSSGIAVIVINNGDNRIILDAGANAEVDGSDVAKALVDAKSGDFLITQLEIPIQTVSAALRLGKEKGLVTVLNPAPAANLPQEIWQYVDWFIPNQSETMFYTGVYPDSIENAAFAAEKLRELGVKNTVITLGSLGSVAFADNTVVQSSAFKVEAVDTTAAGDTFVGAFVTALDRGCNLTEALRYANKAASITVTRRGAQQAIPYRREIK